MNKIIIILISSLFIQSALFKATGVDPISQLILPKPKNYTYGDIELKIDNPCQINYKFNGQQIPKQMQDMLDFYNKKIFKNWKCEQQSSYMRNLNQFQQIAFEIFVKDMNITIAKKVQDEKYKLQILNATYWRLDADKYVGYLRGLETYSQLIYQDEETETFGIKNIPIQIEDSPDYIYRGLMVDTSRHFMPVKIILDTIDSMLYNKLNVLHWHISDADSFPLPLKSFPNITKFGSFSAKEQYSFEDIQTVINQGLLKGIQIIPEVDSPGHTLSWGKSEQLQNITIDCGRYQGQLDPTLNLTYSVVEGIMNDLNDQFQHSDYVHFGGDEVDEKCWDKRPEIKEFMKQNNIKTYSQLQEYYRLKQKLLWKKINNQKPVIYWTKTDINVQDDDIIQWWGSSKDIFLLKNKKNKIILSNHDQLYLDIGYGNRYGGSFGSMYNWDVIYSFNPKIKGMEGQILGGESCLWSEMVNSASQLTRLWGRNSAFAERVWNVDASTGEKFPRRALVSRLVSMTKRLNDRDIPSAPVTSGVCEKNLDKCYDN